MKVGNLVRIKTPWNSSLSVALLVLLPAQDRTHACLSAAMKMKFGVWWNALTASLSTLTIIA